MADFVYEDMLAWRKAHVRESTEAGQISDGVLRVFWTVPIAAKEGARDWLKANRSSIEGTTAYPITIDGANYEDSYRLIRADYGEIRLKTVELVATYGLKHHATLDWTDARVDEGFERQPDDEWIRVVFPSINFSNLKTLRDAVRGVTYTNPVINGDTFTGTYKVLATTIRWDENKSTGDLFVTMGDPEHRITSFRDIGVPSQQDITYIWNVPDAEVQALVDQYSTQDGATVSVSRPTDIPGTADLVVTIPGPNADNISFEFGTQSDTDTLVVHKWNMTKAELEIFTDGYRANEPGVNKTVSATYNISTGRFNATATVSTLELNVEQVKLEDVGVSGHISRTLHYRWNLDKVTLDSFSESFPKEELKLSGKSVRFDISRQPGGDVYDAVAIIEDVDDLDQTVVIKSPSSEDIVEYRLSIDEDDKDLIINNLPSKEHEDGARSLQLERRQNGSYDIVIRTRKSVRADKTFSWSTGTVGHQIDFHFGLTKDDAFGLINELPNDGKTSYSISLSRGGDGYYGLQIRRDDDSGAVLTSSFGNLGMKEDKEFHWGLTEAEATQEIQNLALVDGTRIGKSVSVRRNSRNGTIDLTITKVDKLQENLQNFSQIGANFSVQHEKGFNYPPEQMPTASSETGKSESLTYNRDAWGNINYEKTVVSRTPWRSETYISSSSQQNSFQSWHFSGYTEVPTYETAYGSVSATFDPYTNTYSGTVVERVWSEDTDPWENHETAASLNGDGYIVQQKRFRATKDGFQWYKDVNVKYKVLLTRDRDKAEKFITYGSTTGSGVTSTAGGVGSQITTWAGDKHKAVYFHPDTDDIDSMTGWTKIDPSA
jgi:hypothetical protein